MAFDLRVVEISSKDGGGEQKLLEQLRKLPNDYIAIFGCVLGRGPEGRSEQYDAIVIGPPGIFVFEVKNWKGQWSGDSRFWYRDTERQPSPISSARKKRDFLWDWLKAEHGLFLASDKGSHYWLDYGVVLTHSAVDIDKVKDPAKDKYTFRLGDISDDSLNTIFRKNTAKRIEGYYDARRIADLIEPEASRELLAIDFGTSYSLVGTYTPEGNPHIFADSFNSKLIPSAFGYQTRSEFVGRRALNALSTNRLIYRNYVSSIKTFLGMNEEEYVRLKSRQKPPYASFEKGELIIRLDQKRFTAVEIAGKIFAHLKSLAEENTGRRWTQSVISVPARFTHEQRSAVCLAAKLAGFEIVSLIDEPTAAALAFGIVHRYKGRVAVYDLGGGTFDFSIVEIMRGACREIVKLGRVIGGDDFDSRLVQDCKGYLRTQVAPETIDPQLADRERFILDHLCEEVKIGLSGDDQTTMFLDNWRKYGNIERTITREQFEMLITDLINTTLDTCKEALDECGTDVEHIHDILLVGGSTFIPLVRQRVTEFFGKKVRSDVDANTAIVHGAAIKAGMLMGRVKNAYIMTRLSPVTIGIPVAFPIAWWSLDDATLYVQPLDDSCYDPDLINLHARLLSMKNESHSNLVAMRALISNSGVDYTEVCEPSTFVFVTKYETLYPVIGRNEQIESDGEIVDFKHNFSTTADNQIDISFTVLETESSRRVWRKAVQCRALEQKTIRLTSMQPAGQNGLNVVFRMDRDGRLQVAYSEQQNPQNSGIFVVEVMFRDLKP